MQEILILQRLATSNENFAHIVRYYQAWQQNGTHVPSRLFQSVVLISKLRMNPIGYFHLQMELCAGGSLNDFLESINETAIPEIDLCQILRDLATGLEILHAHGIVHLDIKPENIYTTETGSLKIGDFGMATELTTASSQNSDSEGDAKYMAKELLSNSERRPSSDIFCLGAYIICVFSNVDSF